MTNSRSIEHVFVISLHPKKFPVSDTFNGCGNIVFTSKKYSDISSLLTDVNANIEAMLMHIGVTGLSVVKIVKNEDVDEILSDGELCKFCIIGADEVAEVPSYEMVNSAIACVSIF